MKKGTLMAVMVAVPSERKTAPIHHMIDNRYIELRKLTIYGDPIFTFQLACRDKHDNRIVLCKNLISARAGRLFTFYEFEGIELHHNKFKVELYIDPHFGEGWVELEYRIIY